MATRFRDALDIQAGACNPSGVARALVKAIDEARADPAIMAIGTAGVRADAAVRLICHQLAFLCGVSEIDNDSTTYGKLTQECEARAQERAA